MKNINLLPKKERVVDARLILLNFLIVIVAIVLMVSILLALFLRDVGNELSERLTKYEDTNLELNEYAVKLEKYKEFSDIVNEKESSIQLLNVEDIRWSEILYDVANAKPDGLYISNIIGNSGNLYSYIDGILAGEEVEEEDLNAFIIQGYAVDQFTVSKYVIALDEVADISRVWINTINSISLPEIGQESYFYIIEAYWDLTSYEELKTKDQVPESDIGSQEGVEELDLGEES